MPFYETDLGLVHIKWSDDAEPDPHCAERGCAKGSARLCDFPVGDGKTCDRSLCEEHGTEIAADTHFCPAHLAEYKAYLASRPPERELAEIANRSLSELSPAALSAAMRGGTATWGQWADADKHVRYMEPVDSKSRRRCWCGCRKRATHRGMANGMALTSGCELSMARWVKHGYRR